VPVNLFLSHNRADKEFVRRLASDLDTQGLGCWLDEAEIKTGESLIEKIREGIDRVDYVAVVLSPDSVASEWVRKEVDVAMSQEIAGKKVKVLPVLYRKCELPGFLLGKKYVDFSSEDRYYEALEQLVRDVGVVCNRSALVTEGTDASLVRSTEKARSIGLRILAKPFHRPFQYVGLSIADAAAQVGAAPNRVGNIIVDTPECRMLLEVEGNFVNYVDVELKQTAPHTYGRKFDSEAVLGALSINLTELELVRKEMHFHAYYDHRRKLKVGVSCAYDGGPLSVGFSSKYYGM
jgi:hypothetical protein